MLLAAKVILVDQMLYWRCIRLIVGSVLRKVDELLVCASVLLSVVEDVQCCFFSISELLGQWQPEHQRCGIRPQFCTAG